MRIGCKCIKMELAHNRHGVEASYGPPLRHHPCCWTSRQGGFLYPYFGDEESEDRHASEAELHLHFLTPSPNLVPLILLKKH